MRDTFPDRGFFCRRQDRAGIARGFVVWLKHMDEKKADDPRVRRVRNLDEALEVVTSLDLLEGGSLRVDLASANGHWMERLESDTLHGIVRVIVAGTS